MPFDARKAAQVVAFFARERGGALQVIEASKLAYLADRQFMERFGLTILNDSFYHMEYGPICSSTYDLIKGTGDKDDKKVWEEYIKPRDGHVLALAGKIADEDLEELSDVELEVLYSVQHQFAHLKGFELVEWIHANCKEWKDPGKTSGNLSAQEIFEAMGKKDAEILDDRLRAFGRLTHELEKSK